MDSHFRSLPELAALPDNNALLTLTTPPPLKQTILGIIEQIYYGYPPEHEWNKYKLRNQDYCKLFDYIKKEKPSLHGFVEDKLR